MSSPATSSRFRRKNFGWLLVCAWLPFRSDSRVWFYGTRARNMRSHTKRRSLIRKRGHSYENAVGWRPRKPRYTYTGHFPDTWRTDSSGSSQRRRSPHHDEGAHDGGLCLFDMRSRLPGRSRPYTILIYNISK